MEIQMKYFVQVAVEEEVELVPVDLVEKLVENSLEVEAEAAAADTLVDL